MHVQSGSNKPDAPLQSQKRYAHTQHVMDEAVHARDSSLNKPRTPSLKVNKNSASMHKSLNNHIRHRTTSEDEHIDTIEKRVTRKFSFCMKRRATLTQAHSHSQHVPKLMPKLGSVSELGSAAVRSRLNTNDATRRRSSVGKSGGNASEGKRKSVKLGGGVNR